MAIKPYVEFDWTTDKRDVFPTMRFIDIKTEKEAIRVIEEECKFNQWRFSKEEWGLSIDTGEIGFGVRPDDIKRAIAANGWKIDL